MNEIHSDADLDRYIGEARGYVLLDLWAGWCRPCRVMAPTFEAAEDVFQGDVSFCRMDVDEMEDAAEAFRLQGVPTFILFRDGREAGRIVGYRSKEHFFSEIRKLMEQKPLGE